MNDTPQPPLSEAIERAIEGYGRHRFKLGRNSVDTHMDVDILSGAESARDALRSAIASEMGALLKDKEELMRLGDDLRKSAEMIGYVQDMQHYRDSVKYIAAWDAAISKGSP